ncbi:unnamed protein product [Toxocara canis]|uniref:Uncharacterized protein n=1 Tax=Toxocara canis TaxID=6265 RepID=A0A3P7F5Q4_TOXCA|nr:unnamed protein product [Toxocara canis]
MWITSDRDKIIRAVVSWWSEIKKTEDVTRYEVADGNGHFAQVHVMRFFGKHCSTSDGLGCNHKGWVRHFVGLQGCARRMPLLTQHRSERRKVNDNYYQLLYSSYTAILVLLFYQKRSTVSAADVKCLSHLQTAVLFVRAFSSASGEEHFASVSEDDIPPTVAFIAKNEDSFVFWLSVEVVDAPFGASAGSALLVAEERSIGDTNCSEFKNTLTSVSLNSEHLILQIVALIDSAFWSSLLLIVSCFYHT